MDINFESNIQEANKQHIQNVGYGSYNKKYEVDHL